MDVSSVGATPPSVDGGLAGKVVIITGAAGGIGRAITALFAAAHCHLVLVDLDQGAVDQLAIEVAELGVAARGVAADVATAAGSEGAVVDAVDTFGGLDVLVNVVGVSRPGKTAVDLSLEAWNDDLRLNLTSTFLMAKAAIPHLRRRGGGAIVNVSSGAGVRGSSLNPGYNAAKAGVHGLTKSLAIDHCDEGIRVNAIAPGPVLTPLMERNRTPEQIEQYGRMTLVGHVADPLEIASAVLFLAGSDSSFMTGQVLEVDGGVRGGV